MSNEKRQELYRIFLEVYNTCAERFVGSISELLLFVVDPWKAETGKEEKMKALKKIWSDMGEIELGYTDEVSYNHELTDIQRRLMLV